MKPDNKSSKSKDIQSVRDGKREHERHSGSNKTGVKAVDKRKGGGAHNWGNVEDDLKHFNETSGSTTAQAIKGTTQAD